MIRGHFSKRSAFAEWSKLADARTITDDKEVSSIVDGCHDDVLNEYYEWHSERC
jgi:hypothetical protein